MIPVPAPTLSVCVCAPAVVSTDVPLKPLPAVILTLVISPDIVFHPLSYILTSEFVLSYHIVPVPGLDGAVPDV